MSISEEVNQHGSNREIPKGHADKRWLKTGEYMINFTWQCPTRLVFGKDVIETIAENIKHELSKKGIQICKQGCNNKTPKVLMVYGGGSIKKNGIYDKVVKSLRQAEIQFIELAGAQPNPILSLVLEGIRIVKQEEIDYVLAVGGGSVIDTCKAISFGSAMPEGSDIWEDLFMHAGAEVPKGLGVGVVVTIPAAGSEMSNSCVITNQTNGYKRGVNHPNNYPDFAILDPQVCFSLPAHQTACGCADMLSHLMERYFTPTTSVDLTDALLEAAMRTILQFGPLAYRHPNVYEYREQIMLAGTLAHNNLFGVGRIQDWASHWMEHELSGLYNIPHGAGLAVITPAWMKYVYHANPARFAQFATNVMRCTTSIAEPTKTALAGITALEQWFQSLELPTRLRDLNIDDSRIDEMVDHCFTGRTTAGGFMKLNPSDVRQIYHLAL